MKKLFENLFSVGINPKQPKYLSKRIYVSNIVAVVVALLIALPYSILSYFLFRPIMFIPLIASSICGFVILLNHLGFNKISRFIIGILPLLMAEVFVAYLIPPNGIHYFQMYIVAVGFAITPYLVFDLREKLELILSSAIILGSFLFGIDWLNSKLISDMDASIVIDGILGPLNIFIGISFMMIGVIVMSYQNYRSEAKSEKLIKDMDLQSEEIKNSENILKSKIEEIEQSQLEDKKRNWASEGIAEISTILRAEQDGQKLYDKITSYITEYLEANQCGLFLVESNEYGEDLILKLQSCYAYNRKKFIDKEINPGQGLVGQAYLEKSSVYLKNVPQGYASITSGLGESTPNEMLIVPLIVNNEVEGVFEFASFNKFKEHQIHFLEQLGETLAAFINVNRINERTKLLLEESQQQTEEMKSQEEEMRQNMEELSATQEEMGRKEQEYLNQIEDLKKELEQPKTRV